MLYFSVYAGISPETVRSVSRFGTEDSLITCKKFSFFSFMAATASKKGKEKNV